MVWWKFCLIILLRIKLSNKGVIGNVNNLSIKVISVKFIIINKLKVLNDIKYILIKLKNRIIIVSIDLGIVSILVKYGINGRFKISSIILLKYILIMIV